MDVRTLTLINLIFLFLYAGMMLFTTRIFGKVRGGQWFGWSNLTRGVSLLLLSVAPMFAKSGTLIAGNLLLVIGLLLLHRSLAEVAGRGKTAWNFQLGLATAVFIGVALCTAVYASYAAALVLLSAALAVQMGVTSSLLFTGLDRSLRMTMKFLGAMLFGYALVYMMHAIALYRSLGAQLTQVSSNLVLMLLLASLVANGGTAFGFLVLSAAQLRKELTRQADRDMLTGLLNRRGLKKLADEALSKKHRAAEPLSAVMLDLDGLKVANDTWGHEVGDQLLCAVAKVLTQVVGSRGVAVRLGGDEFLVVLPGMAMGGAMEIAESLRNSIECLDVLRCQPRASFGVASLTGLSWEEAVRQSDEALYRAKNLGKNRVISYA